MRESGSGMAAKERREHKERRRSFSAEHVFLDMEFVAAEVDEQSIFDSGGFQITQDLRGVFVRAGSAGFQFNDQSAFDEQVGEILAQQRPVFIINIQWMLSLNVKAGFAQPIRQGVFVDLLQVAMPMIDMNGVSRLPNRVA